MQEKTRIHDGKLIIDDTAITKGANVRLAGAEISSGQLALPKDSCLTPAAVGLLASLGIPSVLTYPLPRVSIIATGNELQMPGQPLSFGQVYDSNSSLLLAALHQINIRKIQVHHVRDNLDAVVGTLNNALMESDVVCLTGGVSVGDYDFVVEAADHNQVQNIFHKIKQKPGKPFYFGKKGDKLVFGLPGNPASVLTCFYQYVEPALKKIARQKSSVKRVYAPLATTFKKPAGLTHFLKGFYDGEVAMPLTAQESFRLISFAQANCLIQLEEETTMCNAGEIVELYLLP
jgi:molybdopterin molybdotransferase